MNKYSLKYNQRPCTKEYDRRIRSYSFITDPNKEEGRLLMNRIAKIVAGFLTGCLYIAAGTAASGSLYQPKAPEGLKSFTHRDK